MLCEEVRAGKGRVLGTEGAPDKYKLSWVSEYCRLAQRGECSHWPGAALRVREEPGRQDARLQRQRCREPRGLLRWRRGRRKLTTCESCLFSFLASSQIFVKGMNASKIFGKFFFIL